MAALDFFRRAHDVVVLHYNHGTPHADEAQALVEDYCKQHDLRLWTGTLREDPPRGASLENFWREKRYEFFDRFRNSRAFFLPEQTRAPIITCHHLDDAVETWIFSALHGNPKLIPIRRDHYIRPLLLTRKQVLEDWCDRKRVPYVVDPSNADTRFMRNYIRSELMPKALQVNPGLHKVVRKKVLACAEEFRKAGVIH